MCNHDWMDIVAAFGPVIIGLLLGIITALQWWTARDKLRLDLFDKRFAVWVALTDLLRTVGRTDVDVRIALQRFTLDTSDAKFLFLDRVVVYLETVRNKVIDYMEAHQEFLDYKTIGDESYLRFNAKQYELLHWLRDQPDQAASAFFCKYLRFKRI
jgi:hypothetical protein